MSDTIQDAEKAAVAAAEQTANAVNDAAAATNDALAAKYPAPAEPVAVAPPVDNSYAAASAYPQPVAMSDAPVATTVDISGPTATGVVAVPYVESPNKVMYWFTAAGFPNGGLWVGYATLSVLAFLVMCIAGSANNSVWGGMGWQIFNGLQGWLYAAVLAVMFANKTVYDAIMRMWGNTSPVVVQWVWIAVNGVEVIWWIAAMGNIGAWGNCGNSYWNTYWGDICSKSSAVLAFDVFCFFGWLASLTFALLEKFVPKYTGTIGWKKAAAAAAGVTPAAEVKAVPVAMATLESSVPVNEV